MKKEKKTYWYICILCVAVIMVIGYTPLVIPKGIAKPAIWGIPYSLWFSFLLTVALVILTFIGAGVHPGNDDEEEQA